MSLSATLLGLLLLFHGPAYIYYTRSWGPETAFYFHILAAAPGQPVIRHLDLAVTSLFLMVPLGIRCADIWCRESRFSMRQAIKAWSHTSVLVMNFESSRVRVWIIAVAAGALLPVLFLDHQWAKIVEYISSDLTAQDKNELRHASGGSGYYLYNVLVATLAPFLAFCGVAVRRMGGQIRVFGLSIYICLVILAKLSFLSKAPVAIFALQLMITPIICGSLQFQVRTLMWYAVATTGALTLGRR